MSRIISHDKPLTEADEKYLAARGRHGEIARNRKKFGDAKSATSQQDSKEAKSEPEAKSKEGQKLSLDSDIFERVKGLSPASLSAELRKTGIEVPETEREQRIALAKHLQNKRDSAK